MRTRRLNITAKIWLSIGVFVLSYVATTILGQMQGASTEEDLRATADVLFPAAEASHLAEAAFQGAIKEFGEAVVTQNAAALDEAAQAGRTVVATLDRLAATPGLPVERADSVSKLARSMEAFFSAARSTYGAAAANPDNIPHEIQAGMGDLASQTKRLLVALAGVRTPFANDLHNRIEAIHARSVQHRQIVIACFSITLLVAGIVVTVTIRRSITGPINRVIRGVQHAADETAQTSQQIAVSGSMVAQGAQEQAACLGGTSASLNQISSATRQNAQRAGDADRLTGEARISVDRAREAMANVANSMKTICQSNQQVSGVLKSIDEISFNTHILSLNATVEAARAGVAGAGFSVVADEVRLLAKRAADAARRSADIIEKTLADVNEGAQYVVVAQQAFDEVSSTIATSTSVVTKIAASSVEQAQGVEHIEQALARMEAVTQTNAATAQQTAQAASSMKAQVNTTRQYLHELVAVLGLR